MKKSANFGLIVGLAAVFFFAAAGAYAGPPETYLPDKKSLNRHPVPKWFHDDKFGIFIHWSLSCVPAFAPVSDREIWQIGAEEGIEGQMKLNPYAEWYLNALKIDGSPTQEYHYKTYGKDYSYFEFAKTYNQEILKWDPDKWAKTFKKAGARYVVLVTKHHDGFLLWPSERQNPFKENYYAGRDLVGELTRAVKDQGMRMGFYYSGGLDWTFQTVPITDAASYLTNGPDTKEYADYVDFHFRELIQKYQPSILWNDICYPPEGDYFKLMADYYNQFPEGVVNDRWMQIPKRGRKAISRWPLKQIINWAGNKLMTGEGLSTPVPPHADFLTPEYATFNEIKEKKWECTRGIGYSYGYNQMESGDDFLKPDEAVRMLIDIVSKNGNLLLNVGPRPDGSIPEAQVACILGMGDWLGKNGDAIYGTRPWVRAEGRTACGVDVRFTKKGDTLYLILMDTPAGPDIVIPGLVGQPDASIKLLDPDTLLAWSQKAEGLAITLPKSLPQSPAHALALSGVGSLE